MTKTPKKTRKIKSKIKPLKGEYILTVLKAKPTWFPRKIWLKLLKMGLLNFMIKRQTKHKNLIVFNTNNGMNLIIRRLGGDDTYDIQIDNASIGTGTTAPTDNDTDLETPVLEDIEKADTTFALESVMTEWFITDSELPDDDYSEFGLKCGTQLFCRSLIDPVHTKEANEDTLIQYTISADNSIQT